MKISVTASEPAQSALPWRCLLAPLVLIVSGAATAGQAVLHMEIGDPARRGREVAVTLDGITDTRTGERIAPGELARRLSDTGILFIGENHTDQDFHDVQLRVIRALHDAGREVLVGLEMFPYTEQATLDRWIGGHYTETGFVELGGWYEHWGYHWNYYREIFGFARDKHLPMFAINSPRELVKAVRTGGFDSLSPEQAAHLPPRIAPGSEEHRRMYRGFFSPDDTLHMNEQALDGLYRAQTMWDATMGWNALQALRSHGGDNAIMVVLIGAGHVTFGLGSERQIDPWYDGDIASLVPVTVVDDEGKPVRSVRASYASFVWGVPQEQAALYPSLGVSLMGRLGGTPTEVIQVSANSPAARAGLTTGDVLLELDGQAIGSDTDLRKAMAVYRWGDEVRVTVQRAGKKQDILVAMRR